MDWHETDNMAGFKETDNKCPSTFVACTSTLYTIATCTSVAATTLAIATGDTAATACFFIGATFGCLQFYNIKGLACVVAVLVTASAVCFVRDSAGIVLEIYPQAWTKALFPTLVDFTTPRNGFLVTVLHSVNPFRCYIQNNAMLVSINVVSVIGTYNGQGTIAANSCLMAASRVVTTYIPPVYENLAQVFWGTFSPTHIPMQGMLLNEVTGCIDRVCIATFAGFFVGVLAQAQGKRAAFNTDFLGKRWMISFLFCKVFTMAVIVFMSIFNLDARSKMFSAGVTTDFVQMCLLCCFDPTIWHVAFRIIEFAKPVCYDDAASWLFPAETLANQKQETLYAKKEAAQRAKEAREARALAAQQEAAELRAARDTVASRLRSQTNTWNRRCSRNY
ncbi:hypothetical protein T484DRAFT_1854927 [Baffinella frigidus]|nr:hypothetical protein T484DRAFT_1854927 [Cryptophyta sp. CCMP2293]